MLAVTSPVRVKVHVIVPETCAPGRKKPCRMQCERSGFQPSSATGPPSRRPESGLTTRQGPQPLHPPRRRQAELRSDPRRGVVRKGSAPARERRNGAGCNALDPARGEGGHANRPCCFGDRKSGVAHPAAIPGRPSSRKTSARCDVLWRRTASSGRRSEISPWPPQDRMRGPNCPISPIKAPQRREWASDR